MNSPLHAIDPSERTKLTSRVVAGRAFLVKTHPAERLLYDLQKWLLKGARGGCVVGAPTLGKTSAIRWALQALSHILGGRLPWFEIPIRGEDLPYKREFFQHCLRCCRHKLYRIGTGGDKRDRFTEFLVERSKGSIVNGVVLFLDEAQQLQDKHYEWLLNIGNEVDQLNGRVVFVLAGQKKLLTTRDKFIANDDMQFVKRFFSRVHSFSPLSSESELKYCFEQFGKTAYPRSSSLMFPQLFVPSSWDAGFRPEDLAAKVWAELSLISEKVRPDSPVQVSMASATAALMSILNDCADVNFSERTIAPKLIEAAVWDCGYQEELGVTEQIERPKGK